MKRNGTEHRSSTNTFQAHERIQELENGTSSKLGERRFVCSSLSFVHSIILVELEKALILAEEQMENVKVNIVLCVNFSHSRKFFLLFWIIF